MAITNLNQYYQSQGQTLPSVKQRATLASQAGIQGYTGSAQQNNQLLSFLQGQNNGTVAAPALGNVQPIKVPPPQDSTAQLNSLVASYNPVPLQQDVANAEGAVQQGTSDLTSLMSQLEGYGAESQALQTEAGIPTISKDLKELNDIARQKTIQYQTTPYSLEGQGRGITTGILRGQEAVKQRQLATDIMLTNSSIQAKQGDLALAQQTVQNALDAKYEPLKARIETQKFILEQNKDNLSRADRKLADERTTALNLQMKKIEQEQEREKSIEDMIIEAAAFQAPNSVLTAARNLAAKGGKASEIAGLLGQYSGDAVKAELLKEQIKTEKAQRANINQNIAKSQAEMKLLGSSMTGTDGISPITGKPLTVDQVANAGYADRISQANKIIDSNADTFAKMNYAQFKLAESKNMLANSLLTPAQRQVAQAMRNFITAKLRKESGAAISPTEFEDARLQYFPSLGDDPGTLDNKKALRDSVLNNLSMGSGGAYQSAYQPIAPPSNEFSKALGQSGTSFGGTSIISSVGPDGKFNFKLP